MSIYTLSDGDLVDCYCISTTTNWNHFHNRLYSCRYLSWPKIYTFGVRSQLLAIETNNCWRLISDIAMNDNLSFHSDNVIYRIVEDSNTYICFYSRTGKVCMDKLKDFISPLLLSNPYSFGVPLFTSTIDDEVDHKVLVNSLPLLKKGRITNNGYFLSLSDNYLLVKYCGYLIADYDLIPNYDNSFVWLSDYSVLSNNDALYAEEHYQAGRSEFLYKGSVVKVGEELIRINYIDAIKLLILSELKSNLPPDLYYLLDYFEFKNITLTGTLKEKEEQINQQREELRYAFGYIDDNWIKRYMDDCNFKRFSY